MGKSTKAEQRVYEMLNIYLTRCKSPPSRLLIHEKQAAAVRQARQRRKGVLDTDDYLEFSSYQDIPVAIYEEVIANDTAE